MIFFKTLPYLILQRLQKKKLNSIKAAEELVASDYFSGKPFLTHCFRFVMDTWKPIKPSACTLQKDLHDKDI